MNIEDLILKRGQYVLENGHYKSTQAIMPKEKQKRKGKLPDWSRMQFFSKRSELRDQLMINSG